MKASSMILIGLLLPITPAVAQPSPELGRRTWISSEGFTAVVALRELSDGRVIVADRREGRVVALGPAGEVLRDISGVGQGPGEFVSPTALLPLEGDTTLITDQMLRRYVVVSPNLVSVRTVAFPPAVAAWAPRGQSALETEDIIGLAGSASPEQPWVTLARFALRSGETATLLRMQSTPAFPFNAGGREMVVAPRFPHDDGFAVAPTGEIAVARAAEYRVEWFDRDGKLRVSGPPTPYAPIRIVADEQRGPFGARIPTPEFKPAFRPAGLHIALTGLLWAERYDHLEAPRIRYDIFDLRGSRIRTDTLPQRRALLGFGRASTYLVFTDEDGLQWIECYRW